MFKHSKNEVTSYAKLRDLKFFILFILDFPFSIPLSPFIEMTVSSILTEPFQEKRERFFAVCSEYYWSESVDIPGREVISATIIPNQLDESIKYTQQSTRVKLIVQVHSDEVDKTEEILDKPALKSKLLIRLLSILEIKLVEVKGFSFGSEFINYGADRVLLFRYDDNVDRIEMIHSMIACKYTIDWSHYLTVGTDNHLCSDDTCMWRYYANRSEIAYNRKQNTDCVLYAAISIESFIHQLMLDNNLISRFESIKNNDLKMLKKYKAGEITDDEFLKSINGSVNYSDSVFGEVSFLFENKVISNSTKKNIEKCFGKINQTRNAIVHGDMESVLISDEIAKKAYESMVAVFHEMEFGETERTQLNLRKLNKEIEIISEKCKNGDNSTEQEFLRLLDDNISYSFSCFNLGIINYSKADYDRSKYYFLKCIEKKRYLIESYYYLAKIALLQKDYELRDKYKSQGLSPFSSIDIKKEYKDHDFEVVSGYVDALSKL